VRRTVGIIFDLRNTSGDAGFIALEIDDSIKSLVAAASAPHRNASVIIAAGNAFLRLKQ
jgi:hypothetical protein